MKAAVAALNTLVCNSDGVRRLSRHPRPRTPEHPNTRESLDGGFEKNTLFSARARARQWLRPDSSDGGIDGGGGDHCGAERADKFRKSCSECGC